MLYIKLNVPRLAKLLRTQRCEHADKSSSATTALVLRFPLRVALEDDQEAYKHPHEVKQELHCVCHEVLAPRMRVLDDHLRTSNGPC